MITDKIIQSGKNAVVMGLGVSGLAMTKFLMSKDVAVSVSDGRKFNDLSVHDQEYLQIHNIPFEGGGHSEEFLSRADFVAISPGVPTDLAILNLMREKGVPILGELAIAAPYLSECVVAVTGTNGKTTVTALIGELLKASGKKVFVGGNIGTPLLNYLLSDEKAEVLVLELSSFQLESAGDFNPHIGVLLNITPDHLDRHKTMENYAAAKMKMFSSQKQNDIAIVCGDDAMYSRVIDQFDDQEVYCFGAPKSNCDATGINHQLTLSLEGRLETYEFVGTKLDSHTGILNSGAAILAASLLGCKQKDIEHGLKYFIPPNHRLQHVRKRNGVDYYNDSKATNTGAVLSALESFSGNVLLIAGGRDKGEDYTVLKTMIQKKVTKLFLIGEAADTMAASIGKGVPVLHVKSLAEAVSQAAINAKEGDTVLLAPACASFDMFDNYGQRGDVFMQLVNDLPEINEGVS